MVSEMSHDGDNDKLLDVAKSIEGKQSEYEDKLSDQQLDETEN